MALVNEDRKAGVIVERRDELTGEVQRTVTNARGSFRIRGLKRGEYVYKVTENGFQSEVGRVVIERGPARKMRVSLRIGV